MIRNVPRTLRDRWTHFWFEPVGPLNLDLCRVLFFGVIFLLYQDYNFARWAEQPDSSWIPVWLFDVLNLPLLSGDTLAVLHGLWLTTLALSCIGLFTRVSTISSFVLGTYLLGLPENFGKVGHSGMLVVFTLGVMALSRCGDSSSVDQLIRKVRRGSDSSAQSVQVSGEYKWPVRTVWVLFAFIFFGAGISKLRESGLEWIFSDNLAILLTRAQLLHDPTLALGFLSQWPWIPQVLAAGTIIIEVGYPLALFIPKARWFFVPGAFFMQVGISLAMAITFSTFLALNLFWVRWDYVLYWILSLLKRLNPRKARSAEPDTS